MADLFENLNNNQNLQFFVGDSADEVLGLFQQIRLPTKIIAIYAQGFKHFIWFQSTTKIKKVKVQPKNSN